MEKHEIIRQASEEENKEEEKVQAKKSFDEVDDTYNVTNFVLH